MQHNGAANDTAMRHYRYKLLPERIAVSVAQHDGDSLKPLS